MSTDTALAAAKQLNAQGTKLAAAGAIVPAVAAYSAALRTAPNCTFARFNRAAAIAASAAAVGRRRAREEVGKQSHELQHKEHDLLHNALTEYMKVLRWDPQFAAAAADASGLALKLGRHALAAQLARWAVLTDPDCQLPEAAYNLNTALRCIGKQAEAVLWSRARLATHCGWPSMPTIECAAAVVEPAPPATLTVVCVKYGTKYGADYVNKLCRGVGRHLSVPHRFVCLTDDPHELLETITVVPLKRAQQWPGWWNKAEVFDAAHGWHGRMLYIDLDTVVTGSLDELAHVAGGLALLGTDDLANEGRVGGFNSSIMMWDADWEPIRAVHDVLAASNGAFRRVMHRFDHWLEVLVPGATPLQSLLPAQLVEYVGAAAETLPPDARLVNFPLQPKPHQATAEWITAHWT